MTGIEWTQEVWNPVTGCSKISLGCRNCYAERMANRLRGRHGYPAEDPFRVVLHLDRLGKPATWKRPRLVFVNSMADLFHQDVPEGFISRVLRVMEAEDRHRFQVLTKRVDRALEVLRAYGPLPPNVWIGASVENKATADDRIPKLLQIEADVRFLSCEPLLGPLNLWAIADGSWYDAEGATHYNALAGASWWSGSGDHGLGGGPKLGWVIVGGETGPGFRPMEPAWALSIVDQCREAGVPVFVKQMAGRAPIPRELQVREFPR